MIEDEILRCAQNDGGFYVANIFDLFDCFIFSNLDS